MTRLISLLDNRHSGKHHTLGNVRTTKGGRGRRIPIHPSLRAELEKLTRHPSGRVCVGPKGGVLKADHIRTALIRHVINPLKNRFPTADGAIGFEHGRLHSFRHFFVSQAFLGGASEGEIREWVGHRDSRIVERYRHLADDDARRKMNRINFFADRTPREEGGRL